MKSREKFLKIYANIPLSEEMKRLVIFRIETLPSDRKMSLDPYGEFTKDQLITHVKNGNEIGRKIMEI